MLDFKHPTSIFQGIQIFQIHNIKSDLSYIVFDFSVLGESISKLKILRFR